jgi:hypothetical protein
LTGRRFDLSTSRKVADGPNLERKLHPIWVPFMVMRDFLEK